LTVIYIKSGMAAFFFKKKFSEQRPYIFRFDNKNNKTMLKHNELQINLNKTKTRQKYFAIRQSHKNKTKFDNKTAFFLLSYIIKY